MAEGGKKPGEARVVATNRRARFEFHVLEELECGIALTGTEVKSLRAKECSIAQAFAMVRNGEMWLVGMHIPEYEQGNVHNHEPARDRKLLLHKREIEKWHGQVKVKGMTIVPLSVYFKGSRAKVAIALCKGKKLYDKRADKKEKEDRREMNRAMSRRR